MPPLFSIESVRNLAIFIVVLGGLVFFHELGHFLAALAFKVKVKEFGIGFPPRLIGTALDKEGKRRWFGIKSPADLDPNSTVLSLNWIPLGGFVRPAGEDDPSVPDGLSASPKVARFAVLAAGPFANLIIGFLVFTIGYTTGWPDYRVKINKVIADAPAAAAGIKAGDVVLSANGEDLSGAKAYSDRLSQIVHANLGKSITIIVQRDEQSLTFMMIPRTVVPDGQGPIGVELGLTWKINTYSLPQAMIFSVGEVLAQTQDTLLLPVRVIVGTLRLDQVRFVSPKGLKDISDVVVDTAVELQAWFPILKFVGTITVALALTNLLPLPALDGGRILFVLLEAIRGKRVAPEREGLVHMMGLMVLLVLMIGLVINDLVNPLVLR
jgi:regulator of sigma E protease